MCVKCRGRRRSVVLGPLFGYVLVCLSMGISLGQQAPLSSNNTAPAQGQPSVIDLAKQARQLAAAGHIQDALVAAQEALARGEQAYGPQHEFVGFINTSNCSITSSNVIIRLVREPAVKSVRLAG